MRAYIGNGVVLSPSALMQEIGELERAGIDVRSRLSISPACPLVLPSHVALDQAREAAMGADKIGTTGRGIGPAYEDKIARRAVRVQDLFYPDRLSRQARAAARLSQLRSDAVLPAWRRCPLQATLDATLALAAQLEPMVADVAALLQEARRRGDSLLFEGAQGALLDIDHGTYPYVTSSNCLAGAAAPGAGIGPQLLDYVLGIVKAYTTRVGTGPFPTELSDAIGAGLAKRGNEFGSVTGRPRRCGWLDIPALKRSLQLNGVDGLCITKLDVLDGMDTIRICTRYETDTSGAGGHAGTLTLLPSGADAVAECKPVYEDMPGWSESTFGVDSLRCVARERARVSAAHRDADRSAHRDGVDRARARRDDSACIIPFTDRRRKPDHEPARQLGRVQHADRTARAPGATSRAGSSTRSSASRAADCASATSCRASTSCRWRSCRRIRTPRKAARCAASSSSPST